MANPAALDLESLRARFLGSEGNARPAAEGRGLGFFEAALERIPSPAAVIKDGIHIWVNPAYAQLMALPPKPGLVGQAMTELLQAESAAEWQAITSAPPAARPTHLKVKLKVRSGKARELDFALQTFHQGATDYLILTAQDLQVLRQAEEAFKRNEHWWRHFFEASIIGVAVLSPERKILDANDALLELVGYSRAEIVTRDWSTWLGQAEAGAEASQATEGRGPLKAELTILRKDGLPVPIRVGSHPIYTPDGAIQCYLAIVQDLTELHAHKAREALLLQAIEQSPATIVITNGQGTIEYVNEAFTRTTGYLREEAIHQNPRILKSGVQSPDFYAGMWQALSRGDVWTGRICNRRKDGSNYWELATISPVLDQGKVSHYLAVKEDLTDRLELESANERLASAIAQAQEGVFLATTTGTLIYANEALRKLLPPEFPTPVPGLSLTHYLPPAQRRETFKAIRAMLASGRPWEGRLRLPGSPTKFRNLGGTLSLVIDTDGRGACVVGVFQDLTREMEDERSLIQAEKMNALGALAGGVVHDLNNVLSAILTASELLEWTLPEDAQAHAKLQVIRQAVLRARDINRRIQTFSRKEQESQIPFDLSALVKEVCILLKTTLPPTIHFSTALGSSLWTTGNPAQLHQVLMNLAVNSYQALGPREGNLEITLKEGESDPATGSQPQLLLTVADNGPGIAPEVLEHIFEPYFTTKSEEGGTGLGLSVVQKILAAHEGSIQIESTIGLGTTASITLPMATRPPQDAGNRPDHDLAGIESVLLVGEDEVQLALMKQGLNRLGYQVTVLADGMLALEAVRKNPAAFDVVVTEPEPKALDGKALLGHLRTLRQDLALIQITDLRTAQGEDLDLGAADSFLTRPAGLQDLARAIREVAPRLKSHETASSTEASGHSRNLCVLLAEDSSSTRALVKNWLRKLGCEVLEARDGELAWELYTQNRERLDFVFTDIVMPRMDGLQLTERIRTTDPSLPVVVLTSLEDHESAKSALNLRVDEFLNKPFSQGQLVACVDRLVGKLQAQKRVQESQVTAKEVRKAQKALVATPEPDVPIFTVHQSLTDAGGDLFKWYRRPDGSIFFVLGDVMGHSVLSSYAVAAFLGMLSSLAPKAASLRDLVERLNQGVKEGPFPDIPVCALLGHWNIKDGRVHLVNAGIPHGCLADRDQERAMAIQINGTPLGFFDTPVVEEKVMWLREGDRLLFSTDGVMECVSLDGSQFSDKALHIWNSLGGAPVIQSLEIFCAAAQLHGSHGIQDDVLVVAFEQGPTEPVGTTQWIPSKLNAVDGVITTLERVLDQHDRGIPLTKGQRFNIVTAAREALINAVSHGNQERPEFQVFFQATWLANPPRLRIVVADEGLGFERPPELTIPDPESTRGRGLPFIYNYAATTTMVGGELTLTFEWEA